MVYHHGSKSISLRRSLQWFVAGYYVEHLANILLIFKIHKQKSVYGVSLDSQIMLLIATLSRIVWFSDTKLSTITLAYAEITLAVLLHLYIIVIYFKYRDRFIEVERPPWFLRAWFLELIAFVMSMILHPGDKHKKYFFT